MQSLTFISRDGILQKLSGAAQQFHPFPACTRPLQDLLELSPYLVMNIQMPFTGKYTGI